MSPGFVGVTMAVAGVVAAWALVSCVRGRRFDDPLFYAVALLELVLVAQLVAGIVALTRTSRGVDGATFVSYLITAVLMPPVAVLWAASDRSRWGTGVVVILGLVEIVLTVRLSEIWTVPHG
ncbi:MAG: hypothetical protein H0V48_06200 [Nocardioidaceae bacterium]|nr:hypothetical protein [Nocardioidaceae bacterium]